MIRVCRAGPEEQIGAEALWSGVFGDDPQFQRRFYRLCAPEGPLVLSEDGKLISMLALPELFLTLADGRRARAGYVYALSTRPECRGRGYAAALLEAAAGLARRHGLDCLLAVPAQPPLFRFFARCGFRPGFYCQRGSAAPQAAPAVQLAPAQYNALREALLAGRAHTGYTTEQLEFQRAMCPVQGSGLYRLELSRGPACAAVENWPGTPVVKELLCHPDDTEQGRAAAAALCGMPVRVRTPAGREEGEPFAVVRWLEGTPPSIRDAPLEGWLGLAFD